MSEDKRREYYKRIRIIVGNHFQKVEVLAFNAPFVSKALELLVSCGLLSISFFNSHKTTNFFSEYLGCDSGDDASRIIAMNFKKHNLFENRWKFKFGGEVGGKPALVIGGGSRSQCLQAYGAAKLAGVPAVIGMILKNGISLISVVYPDERFPFEEIDFETVDIDLNSYFSWVDLSNQMANACRAILLEGTNWQRDDVCSLLNQHKTTIVSEHPSWPWSSKYIDLEDPDEKEWLVQVIDSTKLERAKVDLSGKTVLIVGLGSLGSVIAKHYQIAGANVVGIDGKKVSLYNPIRQIYSTAMIGVQKAYALPQILAADSGGKFSFLEDHREITYIGDQIFTGINTLIPDSKIGSNMFSEILDENSPDLIIFATANSAEFRMAKLARERNIAHIQCSCYPRARWYRNIVVNGSEGPCYGCLHGQLYTGVSPTLTEEQIAAYSLGDKSIDAEPATMIDTARCADSVARIGLHLMASRKNFPDWLSFMLEKELTYLIGGNSAEFRPEGDGWTNGVETPGGAAWYGVKNVMGYDYERNKTCIYCGKVYDVKFLRTSQKKQGGEIE
jgi:hypothetical protein